LSFFFLFLDGASGSGEPNYWYNLTSTRGRNQ
ncbi:hypothetical protein CRG98_048595, partial [Punica granatum]